MKTYVKFSAVIICFLFIISCCGITDASSIKKSINNEKILMIVKDVEEMNMLDLSEFEGSYDIVQERNIDYDSLDTYSDRKSVV